MNILGYLTRHSVRIGLGFALVALMLVNALGGLKLDFVQRLESYAYDLRLQWTMSHSLDKRIVILDIDEKSLQQQGHWPWPRNRLARIVDLLFDHYKIDVLGFDVVFAERDESSGLKNLEALARHELRADHAFKRALDKLRPQLNYDEVFANSLKNRRVALGYYFRHDGQQAEHVGLLPAPALDRGSFDLSSVGAVTASGYAANLPELQHGAMAAGFFNSSPLVDRDGVLRRTSLLQMYEGALYETLGLAMARLALRERAIELGYASEEKDAVALEFIKLGRRSIPVDMDVAALIPYRGKQGSFPYVSASDVLQRTAPADILQGAIVLVGTTAPGLKDMRTSPMQESYAGVEVHANLLAGILDGNVKERPAYTLGLELVLLLAVGGLLALSLPALSPLWASALTMGLAAALAAFNLSVWQSANLVLPIASLLLLIAGLFVFNMAYGFFVESRGKRMLAGLFGQYVPPELVAEMAKNPEAFTLAGESREMTILFSDVRGFTSISEGLDPRQLTQLMNEFLTPMTHVIHRHRGTIDKYMGDAIMAFWGAPMPDPQHARHALMAALDMIASLDAMNERFKTKGWPPLNIGVGLNTGEMAVGNMGSEFRLAYTVMGDAVNLGSRLEGLTKEYGVQIIVSEYTRAAVPDFVYRELDRVRVKGKDKPVGIYEPICPVAQADEATTKELASYSEALNMYREQDWALAEERFAQLRRLFPRRSLYDLYARRIVHFREHPPGEHWDGSYAFTTKS